MSDWFREYSPGIMLRFCCMLGLWILYGMVPHALPFSSLLIITVLMAWYGAHLFKRRDTFMAFLIFAAALLNTLLAVGINPFILIALIFAILVFDVINTPQRT